MNFWGEEKPGSPYYSQILLSRHRRIFLKPEVGKWQMLTSNNAPENLVFKSQGAKLWL